MDEETVFTVKIDMETGELDYDPTAFDGYAGGPVVIRGVDGAGNTFLEHRGENLGAAMQSLMTADTDTQDETFLILRLP